MALEQLNNNTSWGVVRAKINRMMTCLHENCLWGNIDEKPDYLQRVATDGIFFLKGDGTEVGDVKAVISSGMLQYLELSMTGWVAATLTDINLSSHGSLNERLAAMENAREFKGSVDSTGTLSQLSDTGSGGYYIVSIAGALDGTLLAINDMLICHTEVVGTPVDLSSFSHISSSIGEMIGATTVADGIMGSIPKPIAGQQDCVLKGSGLWEALEVMADVGDFKTNIRSADYDGWKLCNGRALTALEILSLTNSGIYTAWNTAYGDFLPDPRGRALGIAGADGTLTSRSIGDSIGSETHQLTESELPSHNHPLPIWRSDGGYVAAGGDARAFCTNSTTSALNGGVTDRPADQNMAVASNLGLAGSNGAHNNMQPTLFLGNLFVFLG